MKTGIVAIAKNEDKYIDEFIRYHLKLGIDQIVVFQNNWRYSGPFTENFHVHWYVQDGEVQQLNAYNGFLRHPELAVEQLDWCAFIDVDEFICVRDESRTLQDILEDYKDYASLAINWRLFGDSGIVYNPLDNSVVNRFTKCEKVLNRHVKQLLNMKFLREHWLLSKVMFCTPHCGNWAAANLEKHAVIGPFNTENLDKEHCLELNHYVVKTKEECLEKVQRGRADCAQKRNFEEFFAEHNKNDIANTIAKEFYASIT